MGKRKNRHSGRKQMPDWVQRMLMGEGPSDWDAPRLGTRNLIFGNIWVGDKFAAASQWDRQGWTVVDVREGSLTPSPAANVVHRPILEDDDTLPYASPTRLEAACTAIDAALDAGQQVIVHCWQGLERSPLTLVYWLMTRQGMDLSQAYAYVKAHRNVYDRRAWLKPRQPMGFAS